MVKLIYTLLAISIFSVSLIACSESTDRNSESGVEESKTPEDAINALIVAYGDNNLDSIRLSIGTDHRFGSNIVDGLEWLGNCLNIMGQCIKVPVQVIEEKQVSNEVAVAVTAKNLVGSPMSVWFITSSENGSYKVTGMNTRYECALKTPEQKEKDRENRKLGDYTFC